MKTISIFFSFDIRILSRGGGEDGRRMSALEYQRVVCEKLLVEFQLFQMHMSRVQQCMEQPVSVDNVRDSFNILAHLDSVCRTDFKRLMAGVVDEIYPLYMDALDEE